MYVQCINFLARKNAIISHTRYIKRLQFFAAVFTTYDAKEHRGWSYDMKIVLCLRLLSEI
jgi:hypothetical protein